jgi:SAM-dependent methyltransferase
MPLQKAFRALKRINLASEPTLRHAWVYLRAVWFVRVRKKLRSQHSDDAFATTVAHNMRSLYGANNRMNLLLFPLSVIETLQRDARILVIGPRNENDLYTLAGLGFSLANIVGLDLISYSPRIRLGDMHAIPFPDGAFDAVVCGWTLSYSANPRKAAEEIRRVTRPGGIVALGVEYSTMTLEDEVKLLGYAIQDSGRRVNSTADIRALFGDSVGTVYFEHDAPNRVSHTASALAPNVSNVALIFEVAGAERKS